MNAVYNTCQEEETTLIGDGICIKTVSNVAKNADDGGGG